jgi:hypothetical protein
MPLKRKIITIAFLSLGVIVIAIGIARLIWLRGAFNGTINNYSVETAFSAIESSVAIIGTCGPTIKYIFSRFIPALRPSYERSTTKKSSGNAYSYGNQSSGDGTRRTGRKNELGYDDLDSMHVGHQDVEMKSDWRRNSDTRSDEQIIGSGHGAPGIIKSVEWTVNTRETESMDGVVSMAGQRTPAGRPAESPAHIV